MKIDIIKANSSIDEYISRLQESVSPKQISSLYWTKLCLERHGVISNARDLDFIDHCVLWVACIVACKRVREVSTVEKNARAVTAGYSLEGTLRKWHNQHRYRNLLDRLNKHLLDTNDAIDNEKQIQKQKNK